MGRYLPGPSSGHISKAEVHLCGCTRHKWEINYWETQMRRSVVSMHIFNVFSVTRNFTHYSSTFIFWIAKRPCDHWAVVVYEPLYHRNREADLTSKKSYVRAHAFTTILFLDEKNNGFTFAESSEKRIAEEIPKYPKYSECFGQSTEKESTRRPQSCVNQNEYKNSFCSVHKITWTAQNIHSDTEPQKGANCDNSLKT